MVVSGEGGCPTVVVSGEEDGLTVVVGVSGEGGGLTVVVVVSGGAAVWCCVMTKLRKINNIPSLKSCNPVYNLLNKYVSEW